MMRPADVQYTVTNLLLTVFPDFETETIENYCKAPTIQLKCASLQYCAMKKYQYPVIFSCVDHTVQALAIGDNFRVPSFPRSLM